ncbi:MAG: hypothetical protein JXB48_10425 [Candidatus Latescibacteria bacterium]|nr:hypothetical protein [Candidatus Latescibacterota bacterium]
MSDLKLSSASLSTKLLVTSLICIIGMIYLTLVVHIWIDTELKPSLVAEAYGNMEYIELTDHAHFYLPYYGLFLFAIPVIMLMFSSYSEIVKRFFAVFPFVVVVIDIASMYLIPYLWKGFAMVLWLAGTCLGTSLFILIVLLMYDVWLRKPILR